MSLNMIAEEGGKIVHVFYASFVKTSVNNVNL